MVIIHDKENVVVLNDKETRIQLPSELKKIMVRLNPYQFCDMEMPMTKLVVLSGAGISAESGIDTYRGEDGTWSKVDVNLVANLRTWKQNFQKVHEYHNHNRVALADVLPNHAHQKVAEWSEQYTTFNMTQNIDDLFERAGCKEVIHLHGLATDLHCQACGNKWNIGHAAFTTSFSTPDGDCCPSCKSKRGVKPGVIFFEEMAPQYSTLYKVLKTLTPEDAVIVIGTGETVLDFTDMLKFKPGLKIIANLHPDEERKDLHQLVYNHILNMPATQAVDVIDSLLKEHFSGQGK